jgi:hypothetical protein
MQRTSVIISKRYCDYQTLGADRVGICKQKLFFRSQYWFSYRYTSSSGANRIASIIASCLGQPLVKLPCCILHDPITKYLSRSLLHLQASPIDQNENEVLLYEVIRTQTC